MTKRKKLRILVCGGRDYKDVAEMTRVMELLYPRMEVLIVGNGRGADSLATNWAWTCDEVHGKHLKVLQFQAEWDKHGYSAGPIRNQKMIDEGKPDLVVWFEGGRGTADTKQRAEKAGIKIIYSGDVK